VQREWTVDAAEAGARLDEHLALRLDISRAAARRLIQAHRVHVDARSRPLKGERVAAAMRIRVQTAGHEVLPRPDLPLRVLASGEGWVAVDKPAGWGVHPLHAEQVGTLLNAAVARWPELSSVGEGGLRGGIVHRLDVETSGVLLLARDDERFARLRAAFRQHLVTKIYLALVEGHLERELDLSLELYMAQRQPARVGVAAGGASRPQRGQRSCRTLLEPLARSGTRTLLRVEPISGYLHQIRATLAHLGHPIVGDAIYGRADARLLLHAWHIAVPALRIEAEAPPPHELASLLER
jgi:23S rRNA pseudouridine1911/1915/1917 synthase